MHNVKSKVTNVKVEYNYETPDIRFRNLLSFILKFLLHTDHKDAIIPVYGWFVCCDKRVGDRVSHRWRCHRITSGKFVFSI